MAVNKNALIRYKTIDKCLQNNYKQWTLNDLIEAVEVTTHDTKYLVKVSSKLAVTMENYDEDDLDNKVPDAVQLPKMDEEE